MLKAFLIVWTLIAGVAAGSVMYIVGLRPYTTVAEQASPSRATIRTVNPSGVQSAKSQDGADGVDSGPAATGSIGPATGRSPTRFVRPAEAIAPSPAGAEVLTNRDVSTGRAADRTAASGQPPSAVARNSEVTPVSVSPPAKRGMSAVSARPEIVALPMASDHEADPAAQRAHAAAPDDGKAKERRTALVAPPALPVTEATSSRPRAEGVSRSRVRDVVGRNEPEGNGAAESGENRAERVTDQIRVKERRAARSDDRAARLAARTELNRAQVSAADGESNAEIRRRLLHDRQQARLERRQVVTERRTRMARDGSLERLLDDFAQSGADYLHERTIRVGTRYLVERTTRHGTQYFYQQSAR